jgi:hypothetical protein
MSMSLMHKISFAFAASGLLVFATPVISELLVSDSFESGNMSPQIANGFRWSDTKVTSVVNKDTEVYITSDTNLPAPENSQWEAKTGDHALMLRYRAGKSWTEQKFYLQRPERELWMSFWLRVPTNYAHPEVGALTIIKSFSDSGWMIMAIKAMVQRSACHSEEMGMAVRISSPKLLAVVIKAKCPL